MINSVTEVSAALLFIIMLLIFRALTGIDVVGPYHFMPQPIDTMSSFIKNAKEWKLIYIPSDIDVVTEIIENVKKNLNTTIKVQGFPSEAEFEKYILFDHTPHKVLVAVVFDCGFKNKTDALPLQIKYHLRFIGKQRTFWWPDKTGWKTTYLFPNHPSIQPKSPDFHDRGNPGYITEGLLAVQHAVDKSIMLYHETSAGKKLFDEINILIQRFPDPAHPHDRLLRISSSFIPLMFIIMFSSIVLSITRSIVFEKEKRLKEYQLIIGLRNWIIWAGYFFTFFPLYIIIILLICTLLFVQIVKEPIFQYSDGSFIFVFLTCYAIASICFAFMVSTFFNK
ncbi:hypothetical protein STEG23_021648, partial [Scotinomys teguina]